MKAETVPRVPATAVLLYWLLVVSGVVASTLLVPREFEQIVPLWAGAILGTGLGQIFALGRLRPWLVALILLNPLWFGLILIAPFGWIGPLRDSWSVVELGLMTFTPAVVCGYASLTERGALLAFWFPATLFMLPILEGVAPLAGGLWPELVGHETWLLLSLLTVLFVAFLHARETRRVALWQGAAAERLSRARPALVLKKVPLRSFAQACSVATTGAVALALTAWIAPHLWQKEKLATPPTTTSVDSPSSSALEGPKNAKNVNDPRTVAASCCPEAQATVRVEQARFKEYFPLRAHGEAHATPPPSTCVVCNEGSTRVSTANQGPGWTAPSTAGGPSSRIEVDEPILPPNPLARPDANPARPASTSMPAPASTPTFQGTATTHDARPGSTVLAVTTGTSDERSPLGLLLVFAGSVLGLEVLLRPLRRLVALRHLRSPLWRETVDQRVSNLWQLVLVGLRDAGFYAAPGEEPEELVLRAGVPGMQSCTTVLERARHGVRVDAADLDLMTREACAAYHAARRRVGWAGRAAAWLRWPLV